VITTVLREFHDRLEHLVRILTADEADVRLGDRFLEDDRLRALARVSRREAGDVERRAQHEALVEERVVLPGRGLDADALDESRVVHRQRAHRGEVCGVDLHLRVARAGHEELAVAIHHLGEQVDEIERGVRRDTAEIARVKIPLRAFCDELQPEVAAHAHHQDRLVVREHGPVGIAAEVGFQALAIRLDEARERPASRLLVALEDHLHADRQLAVELAPDRDGMQHREVLALVVAGPAPPDAVALDHGLEGLRAPAFLLFVRGIDVVVAVEEPRELRVLRARLGVDDGMARGLVHLDHVEAPAPEALFEECDLVADAFAREAHRGEADRLEECRDELVRALADGRFDHAGKASFSSR
jgi:hypothetical protein